METSQPKPAPRGTHYLAVLVAGIALGVIGALALPSLLEPYLPQSLQRGTLAEGLVLEKSTEPNRLLLKIKTDRGVYLATFVEKRKEVGLLVDQGDTVVLLVSREGPFLEDPLIQRVTKPEVPEAAPASESEQAEPDAAAPPK